MVSEDLARLSWQRVTFDHLATFSGWLVPSREDRYEHSMWSLLFQTTLPNLLLVLHAHLFLRYPESRSLRLILMPIIVLTALRCAFAGKINPSKFNQYNFMTSVAAVYTSCRAIVWAFPKKAPQWTGNNRRLPLAVELVITQRGACWDWGIPKPPTKPHQEFLWDSFNISATGLILFDLLTTFIQHPAVTPKNELMTLEERSSGVLGDYHLIVVTFCIGVLVGCILQTYHTLLALIFVAIFPSTQATWAPRPLDAPWKSTSLSELWSKRWHSFFRYIFLNLAYRPTNALLKLLRVPSKPRRAASVLAVFVLSGLIHEVAQEGMAIRAPAALSDPEKALFHSRQGWGARNYTSTWFFTMSGIGVLLEDLFTSLTGIKVQGVWGNIWTLTFITLTGMPLVKVWHAQGMAAETSAIGFTKPLVDRVVDLLIKLQGESVSKA
ncbi:hypothetical protein IE81DRAFT_84371 [Ceraceosorus guamensis]|uniref:Wax synthase domain-containing protein n=1 Tax=Ceraceosorus guamensis TaxID=1522189 RepID=A0A316W8E2_9BASI|nr:hypothetical protein IE81DRAFT_84371 [Ceraceosorus guamensis]PWN46139.1 hypothetical protein IE81DRAFT_84371 [Ceraceosorus guamensis]